MPFTSIFVRSAFLPILCVDSLSSAPSRSGNCSGFTFLPLLAAFSGGRAGKTSLLPPLTLFFCQLWFPWGLDASFWVGSLSYWGNRSPTSTFRSPPWVWGLRLSGVRRRLWGLSVCYCRTGRIGWLWAPQSDSSVLCSPFWERGIAPIHISYWSTHKYLNYCFSLSASLLSSFSSPSISI